ncbi:glycosyltransferase family 2 protein [Legionella cardiaca]|uniref:Glycosyltransferase family 2 protein n=1 Tax=Legionella cardiaca TaxID=1071983 RepID=A0ABY8AMN0_9GAMM|nr:glycosyltransferase family 2 protein [Legionella cardiaca]WED41897.1 glycosyltransferase family 2 protein [Legionella cardiaca]
MHYQFSDKIKIAVVIINYNSSCYLLKALRALAKQNFKPEQVIVFDNGSKEPLPAEIKTLGLPLKVIISPVNLGFAAGNNKAIEFLDPQINWIALLNPDAYPHEDWLMEIVKVIESCPHYAFMGSKLICEKEPHLLDGTGDVYHISGKAWRKNHRKPLIHDENEIREIFSPCAAAAVYRRDAFMAVQGFDENYFCYYEDIDLAFRLRLLGYKGCYVPESIAEHTGSATTERHSDFYTYHGHRNLVWTYFKNMPLPLLIMTLPLHILLNFATIFLFIMRGQATTIFKSKRDALKSIKAILKQRRAIQNTRTLSTKNLLKILEKGLPW